MLAVFETVENRDGIAVFTIVWIEGFWSAVVAGAACACEADAADGDGSGEAADHVFGIVQVDAVAVFDVYVHCCAYVREQEDKVGYGEIHDGNLLLFVLGLTKSFVKQKLHSGGGPQYFVYEHTLSLYAWHAVTGTQVGSSLCAWGKPSVGGEG